MKQQDVKNNLLDHSKAKVTLLGEYLKRYLNIIANDKYTKRINIYDLFCAQGIYENGGEGSPIVIIKAINELHINNSQSKYIPRINCFFNDIDQSKIENLKGVIENKKLHNPEFGSIDYKAIDYKDYLGMLENKFIGNTEKSFIFIDPYEYKHIKISHIKGLMKNKKSEVLLWLPTQFMYRFEANGTPTALKDFIEELVPYDDWSSSDNVWEFIEKLRKGFEKEMGNNFFVDHFSIQKDKSTVFCLFFFTSHIYGYEKMLEAKWELDPEQGQRWENSGIRMGLIENQDFERHLMEFLKTKNRFNGEIYEFTLKRRFLPKHANEILSKWRKDEILDVVLKDGSKARRNGYYNGYQYFKNDFNKVTYILRK